MFECLWANGKSRESPTADRNVGGWKLYLVEQRREGNHFCYFVQHRSWVQSGRESVIMFLKCSGPRKLVLQTTSSAAAISLFCLLDATDNMTLYLHTLKTCHLMQKVSCGLRDVRTRR